MTTSMRRSVVPQRPTLKASLALALTCCASACEPAAPPRDLGGGSPGSNAAAPSSSATARPDDAAFAALFERARASLDPVDLRAVARGATADRLVAAFAAPADRDVARRALLLADDVDDAFLPLARLTRDPLHREAALALLLELTNRPPAFGERLAPEDDAETLAILESLRAPAQASGPETTALAESVLARLRARGLPGP